VQAFARSNSIDRLIVAAPHGKFGIISAGKAYLDLLEALQRMGLDQAALERHGIRLYKPGLTYPLEQTRLLSFVRGLDEVVVVEEKGAVIEDQLKSLLYNFATDCARASSARPISINNHCCRRSVNCGLRALRRH